MLKIMGVYFWPNQEPRDGWLLEAFQWPLLFRNSPRLSCEHKWATVASKQGRGTKGSQQPNFSPFHSPAFTPWAVCLLLIAQSPVPCQQRALLSQSLENQELGNNCWYSQSSASVIPNRSHYMQFLLFFPGDSGNPRELARTPRHC